jgi:glycosyltransferase involved in cell wall biosynthesis
MKVLIANKFFYHNGGAETVFFQERDFLLKHGLKVVDFSMTDKRNLPSPYAAFFAPNINFFQQAGVVEKVYHAVSFVHSSATVKKIEELIIQEKPQIAHLHNIYHQLTPSIIPVFKKYGIKIVLTLHDCKLVCPNYLALRKGQICTACQGEFFWKPFFLNCQNSRMHSLLLAVEAYWHKWRKTYEDVDLFLTPSQFLANLISNRIASEKIRILHNGVDTDCCPPTFSDEGYYALYFGRLSREKGIFTLLQAHEQVAERVPLKIVGTGELEEELRIRYPDVTFLGRKTGEELFDVVANAAFVIVPSECYENCSMAILEAMAFGKPVIASRLGGIPEQINDGETGMLFENGNVVELAEKMDLLFSDVRLREQMGRAARRKVEKEYALVDHNRQLLTIYTNILSRD